MSSNRELNRFLSILDAWNFGHNRALIKYFVSKKEERKYLLYGMVVFTNEEPNESLKNILIETDQCLAGQEIFDLDEGFFQRFLQTINNTPHILNTSKNRFELNLGAQKNWSMMFDPNSYPLINSPMRSPYLLVSGLKDHRILPDIKELDLELRSIPTPFENTNDLMTSIGIPLESLEINHNPCIEYIVTMPISNLNCEIDEQSKLNLSFTFPRKPEKEKFKVGVRLFGTTNTEPRFCIEGNEFSWSEENEQFTATIKKEITGMEIARIYPSYDSHNIGGHTVLDPNLVINNRPEIYSVFFKDHSIKDFLNSRNSEDFEFGVSCLLHHLKLSSQRFSGVKRLKDGPDIVAFSSLGHVYVIECTTGSTNHKGKLLKLHERTEKLKNFYRSKGLDAELIRPVIFTNLSKENIHEDRSEAANYKISIVTNEDFESLINRTFNPPSEYEIFQAALNAIPNNENKEIIG